MSTHEGAAARLRPMLGELPAYVAGRSVPGAVKLASNETPFGPLPAVLERIAEAAADGNRYPDPFAGPLCDALAERYGVTREQVTVGCGSVALCQQLVQITCDTGDEVAFNWRSFEAYPIVAAVAGARAVTSPLLASQQLDLDALAASVTDRTRLVFVCSPNNPTGTAVTDDELTGFLDRVPDDVLVVLDAAYQEFVTEPGVADAMTFLDRPNVLVLRTFSKAYGLAGLRVGYAVANDARLTTALKQVQIPFGTNRLAQAAALASLEPLAEKQLMTRVDDVAAERNRVRTALVDAGYAVPESQANFVWLPLGDTAVEWAAEAEAHGVVTRPFAGDGVRITISTPEENDHLLDAARAVGTRSAG